MHHRTSVAAVALFAFGIAAAPSVADEKAASESGGSYVLGHTLKRIDGSEQPLSDYKGKVVLIVNVASKCGYTPQYAGLQKLYESKKADGFVILGMPANNFGNQEPGTDAEISEFCSSKYAVTFPMFSKISVKGDDSHPLYKQMTGLPGPLGGEVKWNFEKFLVDRTGNVIAHFGSRTRPDDKEMLDLIDKALAQK